MILYGIPEHVEELKRLNPVSDWIIIVSDKPFRNLTAPIEIDTENFSVKTTRIPHLYEIYRKQYGVQETIVIEGESEPTWELKKSV